MRTKLFITLFALSLVSFIRAQELFNTKKDSEYTKQQEHLHEHSGRIFVGGATTFWKDTETKDVSLQLHPEMGYLFNDDWGVGLLLGYGYKSLYNTGVKETINSLKISPFVRYYYYHRGPFNVYFDAGFGVNTSKSKTISNYSNKINGFELGIRPGACIDLTEGLCLCLRIGFVGYRKKYFSGEEEGLTDNGFGIRIAPEEAMIGLEFEF